MKNTIILLASAIAIPASGVTLITPTSITNESGVSEFFSLGSIVDDSGLSGPATFANYTTVTHAAAGAANAWTTDAPNGAGDYFLAASPGTPATFVLPLGATVPLTDFVYWGYHFGTPGGNEGREFTLEFSTDGGTTYSAPITVSTPLSTYAVQNSITLPLGGTFNADTVRLGVTDNHFGGTAAGGDRIGLGEIKFVSSVPEPSSALLGGLAGLMLLRRRR